VIEFNKEKHAYTNVHTGISYSSVTSIINSFKEPFDVEKFSRIVAKREGVSQQEIKDKWKNIKSTACVYGTDSHKKVETYVKSGGTEYSDDEMVTKFITSSNLDIAKTKSETIVFNNEYRIAGTADFIIDNGKTFDVYDLKTNKNFRVSSKYNKFLYAPLSHLSECEYNVYSLQVSTYAYLYSNMTGKNVGSLHIFWLNRENNEFVRFDTPYLYTDVKNMLNSFKDRGFTLK